MQVLNLEAMDKSRHWQIVGCSAYTGEGLLEGFDWLVQDIASRIYMLDWCLFVPSSMKCVPTYKRILKPSMLPLEDIMDSLPHWYVPDFFFLNFWWVGVMGGACKIILDFEVARYWITCELLTYQIIYENWEDLIMTHWRRMTVWSKYFVIKLSSWTKAYVHKEHLWTF